jgi:hypothetical protein
VVPEIDKTQEQILNLLQYGEKRRQSIIDMIDRSPDTIDRKLEYLIKNHSEIEKVKRGREVYYKHKSGPEKNIQPLKSADPNRVADELSKIKLWLDCTSGEDIVSGNPISQKTIDKRIQKVDSGPADAALEFFKMSQNKYNIIDNDNNFEMFFAIFDELFSQEYREKSNIPTVIQNEIRIRQGRTEKRFELLYMHIIYSTFSMYENWEAGFENENLHRELHNRKSVLKTRFFSYETLDAGMCSILNQLSPEAYRERLIYKIKTEDFDVDDMIRKLFQAFIKNEKELLDLHNRLQEAKNRANPTQEEKIQFLIDRIKTKYGTDPNFLQG